MKTLIIESFQGDDTSWECVVNNNLIFGANLQDFMTNIGKEIYKNIRPGAIESVQIIVKYKEE